MNIYIASDHRGVELKEYLINELRVNYQVLTSNISNNDEDDYPDFAFDICNKMDKKNDIGILICGNGIGISIAANKVKGIRCARVLNTDDAIAAKEHNYSNVIALPATLEFKEALKIVEIFITSNNSKLERHQRRVNKIISYEKGTYNEL